MSEPDDCTNQEVKELIRGVRRLEKEAVRTEEYITRVIHAADNLDNQAMQMTVTTVIDCTTQAGKVRDAVHNLRDEMMSRKFVKETQ